MDRAVCRMYTARALQADEMGSSAFAVLHKPIIDWGVERAAEGEE